MAVTPVNLDRTALLADNVADRLWPKALADGTGCWIWAGATSVGGYGRIQVDGQSRTASRVAYTIVKGSIPESLQLDHLCRRRACINPDHLEPVTPRENVLRGEGWAAKNHAKTHCPQGHPYSAENTHINPSGERTCRICGRVRMRLWRARRREA